jgi:tRNA(Phe) wybutosine-synthesizing methylase Tyw3
MVRLLEVRASQELAQTVERERQRLTDTEYQVALRMERLENQLNDLRRALDRLSERISRGR